MKNHVDHNNALWLNRTKLIPPSWEGGENPGLSAKTKINFKYITYSP